ncbi:hypothetical protein [Maritimibacter sp. UBA3975]|uniref:hypothetical protein n=1 Tax=Maritimibacter sp. UBA3975 TaxID=1946833 RepID=UPI000C0B97CC|nr:hypothetical protein [Maritimibacter sp. UBA3975]MAM61767.1 amino acid ABC transporter substrate-binding protein [Maritimibacter sp.]
MRWFLAFTLWCALAVSAGAQDAREVRLGFLALENDPRFDEDFAYARIALRPQGDTVTGVELAIADMKILTDARGFEVTLDEASVSEDALVAEAERMIADGAAFIIVDLPAAQVRTVAEAVGDRATVLNTTAPEDDLRRSCIPGLLHTGASDRMISDALVQHLARQKWTSALVLRGKSERDMARAAAFAEAAERLRIEVVETREFDLSTNPALREENNIMLVTGGLRDYDVIFIADDYGEYSRYVEYQSALPRPVIGAAGLVAQEWSWALERYGAPQVNSRFEDMSEDNRRMNWQDWSTWVAGRAVLTAYAKTREDSVEAVNDYMRSHRLSLDGSKGVPMTFRSWNGQIRMPILLTTSNAVIDIAPIQGFLHQSNTLDSLGQDEAEFSCE